MAQINIAELLKDCPKGTKLYSPICGECELNHVFEYKGHQTISVIIGDYYETTVFEKNGIKCLYSDVDGDEHGYPNGECLLFPSKEVRDWGMFNVKYIKGNSKWPAKVLQTLLDNGGEDEYQQDFTREGSLFYIDSITHIICGLAKVSPIKADYILSTGTELKLEEQPKFKVGDVVKNNRVGGYFMVVEDDYKNSHYSNQNITSVNNVLHCNDCYTLATPEEIAKWNKETLEPNHLHYDSEKRKIVDWFLPFDKVVVRSGVGTDKRWRANLFSHYEKDCAYHYACIGGLMQCECLPYNRETAKLIGATDDWEEE